MLQLQAGLLGLLLAAVTSVSESISSLLPPRWAAVFPAFSSNAFSTCHSVHPQVQNRWLFLPPPPAENTGAGFDSSLSADTWSWHTVNSVLYRGESFPTVISAPQDERRDVLNTVYCVIFVCSGLFQTKQLCQESIYAVRSVPLRAVTPKTSRYET